jgi:hypothetical protein
LSEKSGTFTYVINANTGTGTSVTYDQPGVYRGAAKFNATLPSKIQVTSSASVSMTTAGSISLWAKPTSITQESYAGFVAKSSLAGGGSASGICYWFIWRQQNTALQGGISDGVTTLASTPAGSLPTNTNWVHLVFTWDADNLIIYKNGVAFDPTVNTVGAAKIDATLPLKIGGNSFGNDGGGTSDFDGLIDEVALHNRALTQNEITQMYVSGAWRNP